MTAFNFVTVVGFFLQRPCVIFFSIFKVHKSDVIQCVHSTQRTVFHKGLVSQIKWVRSFFCQFYSVLWILSVCNGITVFNFVSSLLLRSSLSAILPFWVRSACMSVT